MAQDLRRKAMEFMTIREFLDQWPEMPEAGLVKYAPAFVALLTPVSQSELHMAAEAYINSEHTKGIGVTTSFEAAEKSFRGLQKCYADTARRCMEYEVLDLGKDVRAAFGLGPITLDTVLSEA